MPNDRRVRENILVPYGKVVPEEKYIYSLDGELASLNDEIELGDLLFYDPRTNLTIKKGDTAKEVPKLGVAVAVDTKGLGYATALQKVFGDSIDSCAIENFTTDPANCGCNQVMDFYVKCLYKGETYTIEIWTRGDRELHTQTNFHNWRKEVFSVNLKDFACDSCESGIDCNAVMCALVAKMNSHNPKKAKSIKHTGAFIRRALKQQVENRDWTAYVLHSNDVEYSITHQDTACSDCVTMTGIGGININGTTIMFKGTTLSTDPTLSPKGKQDRIVSLINKAFRDSKVEGSAVVLQQLKGSGAPCCDFKIKVNSCVTFDLVDGAGT
ncbi:MAG: hypothetical protein KC414_00050, partial [Romboutsia sp.]|nr:hypothetical protein [Romboutsia sp.]